MAKRPKVEFQYPVQAIHGKPCSHTKIYFGVNHFTKRPYVASLCYPSTTVTAAMEQQRAKFKQASNYAKAVGADSTRRAAAEVRFASQTKYLTLRTFLMAESMSGNEVE